jgi:uncharacterized protein YecE (DUF72 family)
VSRPRRATAPASEQGRLFDLEPVRPRPARVPEALRALAAALPPAVTLGTSSWTFPGWAGLVWDGRPDERALIDEGLRAYAAHPLLGGVGVDRSFWQPLSTAQWASYAAQVPAGFRFVGKAWRELVDPRASARFLDPAELEDRVVGPAREALGSRLGAVLLQLPPLPAAAFAVEGGMARRIAGLAALAARAPLAIEVRSAGLLDRAWAEALDEAGVLHCVNVHPDAPPLRAQRALVEDRPGPLLVRWTLHAGMRYEAARARFAPFDRMRRPDPSTREAIAKLVTLDPARPAIVIVNNKAEGCAPASVEALAAAIVARVTPPGDTLP